MRISIKFSFEDRDLTAGISDRYPPQEKMLRTWAFFLRTILKIWSPSMTNDQTRRFLAGCRKDFLKRFRKLNAQD